MLVDSNNDNSVTHTGSDQNAWWNADLGRPQYVKAIALYNRADCCSERLANYEIRVGNEPNPVHNPACPGVWTGE